MSGTGKPNCYQCIHRRGVPGDMHSSCAHPDAGGNNPGDEMMAILASVGRIGPVASIEGADKLNIEANPHGVAKGWFNWPWNFDPVWLEGCTGFKAREQETTHG